MALTLVLGVAIASAVAPYVRVDDVGSGYTWVGVGGVVNADGSPATTWRFQASTAPDFSNPIDGEEGTIPAGGLAFVHTSINGLQPQTIYYVRLIAESADGKNEEARSVETLAPAAPIIDNTHVTFVSETGAVLNAGLNPAGAETTHRFQYVDEASYEASGFTTAASTPDQMLGALDPGGPVSAELAELEPGTLYRYRLVAENAKGTTEGDVKLFHTSAPEEGGEECANAGALGTSRLSTCRAWEMVSPLNKNGGYAYPQSATVQVSADGNALTFAAGAAFADAIGSSIQNQYLSRRTAQPGTNGWSTHSIVPRTGSVTLGAAGGGGRAPHYYGSYTPDLTTGLYEGWRPLTDAPNVDDIANLYRIDGLHTQDLSPTLLSDSIFSLPKYEFGGQSFEAQKNQLHPAVVGASTDLSHVVFEEAVNLTADAPAQSFFCQLVGLGCSQRLYENANGSVRLVARIPEEPSATECDDEAGPSCVAALNAGAGYSAGNAAAERMVSSDGSRILFQASGDIYLREDGTHTYKLNASEKASPDSPQSAEIWDMSRDGSRIFFGTNEQLVESDTEPLQNDTDSQSDLYMYEVQKPEGERLTLVSASALAEYTEGLSMVGTSDDGHYAYFTMVGQLVPGEPPTGPYFSGLYLWHDGDLTYIGRFPGFFGANIGWRGSDPKLSRITPDGRHLLFRSAHDEGFRDRGGFLGYDHVRDDGNINSKFYLYSAETGRLRCASCIPTGERSREADMLDISAYTGASPTTSHITHALSDDGRFVFFNSVDALVSEDTNGTWDVYQYDSESEKVSLISSGTASEASYFMEASDDGRDVFFTTIERLSEWDTDNSFDIYDARIGGGLPEPVPTTAPCNGDSCLPPSGASAPVAPVASDKPAPGNPPSRCPRGTRKVHRGGKVRCLRKTRKRPASRHNRKANANRRAAK
jgi:hypothetical protein